MANNEKNIYEDILGFEQGSENEKEEITQVSEIEVKEESELPQGVDWEEFEDEEDEIEIDDSLVKYMINKYAKGIGTAYHITPHKLRKTYGTELY